MKYHTLDYCPQCGTKLEAKELPNEGSVAYCPKCDDFCFPIFNVACSMIVLNETKDKVLLIKQYGRPNYILVAGYVNKGEDAEDAVIREVKEEMDLDVASMHFNRSHYYEKSNTLLLNFTVVVKGDIHSNQEVDSYKWFNIDEAVENMKPGSLAERFMSGYITGTYEFDH